MADEWGGRGGVRERGLSPADLLMQESMPRSNRSNKSGSYYFYYFMAWHVHALLMPCTTSFHAVLCHAMPWPLCGAHRIWVGLHSFGFRGWGVECVQISADIVRTHHHSTCLLVEFIYSKS